MNRNAAASLAIFIVLSCAPGRPFAQAERDSLPPGVDSLLATQASPGQPIIGTFVVSPGWGSKMVRVHIGLAYSDSWCFWDLPAGPGSKAFSFDGVWHSQNGHRCGSVLPIVLEAKVTLNVKVEVRDQFSRLAIQADGLAPNTWVEFAR